jgi:hypothetical protein
MFKQLWQQLLHVCVNQPMLSQTNWGAASTGSIAISWKQPGY